MGETIIAADAAGLVLLALLGAVVAVIVAVQLFFIAELWWRAGKNVAAKLPWTLVLAAGGWIGLFACLMIRRPPRERPPRS
ncbi:MAG: hypothetical protein ACLQUT_09640 [Thermoleophilia bacterium]